MFQGTLRVCGGAQDAMADPNLRAPPSYRALVLPWAREYRATLPFIQAQHTLVDKT